MKFSVKDLSSIRSDHFATASETRSKLETCIVCISFFTFKALMKSFRETLKAELNEGYESDMQFSMEALKFAGTQHLKNRNSILDIDERRSSDVLEIGRKSTTPVQRNLTMPLQSEAINEEGKEDIAAVKIQAQFRGHLVRLLRSAQITGRFFLHIWIILKCKLPQFRQS